MGSSDWEVISRLRERVAKLEAEVAGLMRTRIRPIDVLLILAAGATIVGVGRELLFSSDVLVQAIQAISPNQYLPEPGQSFW